MEQFSKDNNVGVVRELTGCLKNNSVESSVRIVVMKNGVRLNHRLSYSVKTSLVPLFYEHDVLSRLNIQKKYYQSNRKSSDLFALFYLLSLGLIVTNKSDKKVQRKSKLFGHI